MAKSDKTTCLDRRGFLKFAGAGAVGSAAVLTSATVTEASEQQPDAVDGGYRESEHVKTYYKLARF